jgi:hypothetical protein
MPGVPSLVFRSLPARSAASSTVVSALAVLVMFPVSAAPAADGPKKPSDGRLSVSVSMPRTEVRLGEPVTLDFTVKNVSAGDLAIWSRACSWGHQVYHCRLRMPDGTTLETSEPTGKWLQNTPRSTRLEKGAAVTVRFDLNAWTGGPLPPGEYTLRGVYRSRNGFKDDRDVAGRLGDLWEGESETDEVAFAVTAGAAAEPPADGAVVAAVFGGEDTPKTGVRPGPYMLSVGKGLKVVPGGLLAVRLPKAAGEGAAADAGKDAAPLAVLEIESVRPVLGYILARPAAGLVLDEVLPGDRVSAWPTGTPLPVPAATPRWGTVPPAPLSLGGAEFTASFGPDRGGNTCIRVERHDSRGAKGRTVLIWMTTFGDRGRNSIRYDAGRLVLVGDDRRDLVLDALTGRQAR